MSFLDKTMKQWCFICEYYLSWIFGYFKFIHFIQSWIWIFLNKCYSPCPRSTKVKNYFSTQNIEILMPYSYFHSHSFKKIDILLYLVYQCLYLFNLINIHYVFYFSYEEIWLRTWFDLWKTLLWFLPYFDLDIHLILKHECSFSV